MSPDDEAFLSVPDSPSPPSSPEPPISNSPPFLSAVQSFPLSSSASPHQPPPPSTLLPNSPSPSLNPNLPHSPSPNSIPHSPSPNSIPHSPSLNSSPHSPSLNSIPNLPNSPSPTFNPPNQTETLPCHQIQHPSTSISKAQDQPCHPLSLSTLPPSPLALPELTNLQQIIQHLSGDFDESKYADIDILDAAQRIGIVFDDPPWWPPGGFPDSLYKLGFMPPKLKLMESSVHRIPAGQSSEDGG